MREFAAYNPKQWHYNLQAEATKRLHMQRARQSSIPPTPDDRIIEQASDLFNAAADHFATVGETYFGAKNAKTLFWQIFSLSQAGTHFTHWKSASRSGKEEALTTQLRATRWLQRIFDGKAEEDVNSEYRNLYQEIVAYWKSEEHSRTLNDVRIYLNNYCKELEAIKERDARAKRREKLAKRNARPVIDNWGLPPPAPMPVQELEAKGDKAGARKWLEDKIPRSRDWGMYVHFLRLTESGGQQVDLDRIQRLREKLTGNPDESLGAAEDFYIARLLGQSGKFEGALARHRENMSRSRHPALYPLRSQFEIAQLHFRLENFLFSKQGFLELRERLSVSDIETLPREIKKLLVDVLKFLGTLERLHTVFDPPFADVVRNTIPAGSSAACLDMAGQAIDLSERIEYRDGVAWGYTVRAFGLEREQDNECDRAYYHALEERHHSGKDSHASSRPHILLYQAGMLRRRGTFEEAGHCLEAVEASTHASGRPSYLAELNTQRALLAEAMDNYDRVERHQKAAICVLGHSESLRQQSSWGIVKRLRAWCKERGWQLETLVNDSSEATR